MRSKRRIILDFIMAIVLLAGIALGAGLFLIIALETTAKLIQIML